MKCADPKCSNETNGLDALCVQCRRNLNAFESAGRKPVALLASIKSFERQLQAATVPADAQESVSAIERELAILKGKLR